MATCKKEDKVTTTVHLTLSLEEADAVMTLVGSIADQGPFRHITDPIYNALRQQLGRRSFWVYKNGGRGGIDASHFMLRQA